MLRKKLVKQLIQSDVLVMFAAVVSGRSIREISRIRDKALSPVIELNSLQFAIASMGARGPLEFVQVGANDGKTGDPIYSLVQQYGGRALLIEPQSWLIEELRGNYRSFSGELVIENKAVSNEPGSLPFYILKRKYWEMYIERVGRHPSAIFSPDRNQLLSRIAPRLGFNDHEAIAAIDCIDVPTERLEKIMERNGFLAADVVQIDCEGWNFEVIKSLGHVRPPIINFESFNLSHNSWKGFQNWCLDHDYGFIRGKMDTLTIRGFPEKITL